MCQDVSQTVMCTRVLLQACQEVQVGAFLTFSARTVEPVSNNHPRDRTKGVVMDSWSLWRDELYRCGFFLDPFGLVMKGRWSSGQVRLFCFNNRYLLVREITRQTRLMMQLIK